MVYRFPNTVSAWITQAAYAKRRGVSAMAVSKAISTGRLRESVILIDGTAKIRDPDLADREWARNTDVSQAPTYVQEREAARAAAAATSPFAAHSLVVSAGPARPPEESDPGSELSRAGAAVKLWDARMRELKYREAAGELVPAASVRAQLAKVFGACKTKLLGIPSQAKQALPHLSIADLEKLGEIVRESLEGLALGDAAPPPAAGSDEP